MSEYLKTNKVKVNGITYELEDSKTKEALENEILRARKAESDLEENLVSCIDNLNILQGDSEESINGKINKAISEVIGSVNGKIEKILWNNLIIKINKKELITGQKYKIIDYVTTTSQESTKSANHVFDVIVEALSENTLNENAKACIHEGDTYFQNSKLNAWEIKYCLDNDTSRFDWADTINGKGVIYYMKDEYGNEASYDFKNIQFNILGKYHYTFSYDINNVSCDGSVDSRIQNCNKNIILSKYQNNIQILNNNVFINTKLNSPCVNNKIVNGSFITISDGCCNTNIKGEISNVDLDITPNSEYEIIVSKNSEGNIKIYCEADLIL